MRNVIAVLAGLLVAGQVWAQSVSDDIQGVISAQVEAFQVDDYATAFTYASPNIKRIFGSAERFGQMVANGYPMVHRPSSVDFARLEERAGRQYQSVIFRDQAGGLHLLEYEMVPGNDGWVINGVSIKRPGAIGA
ncbi:MAG: DUF4864 domain-containing protein [Pseudomonadota bacterium]